MERGLSQPLPPWAVDLPVDVRDTFIRNDPTGVFIRTWASANRLDDEGRIQFLDFKNMVVHHQGRRITIRDGVREGKAGVVYSAAFNNAAAINL
jgi:hypothetical protein